LGGRAFQVNLYIFWLKDAVTQPEEARPGFQMLKKTLNAYHNRAIATQEVIEELIHCSTHRVFFCGPGGLG
jgi:hypothetical protein